MCVPSHVCNSSAAEPRVEMALTTSWNVNIWTQVKSPFPENLIMICAFNGVSDGLGVGSGSICESEGFLKMFQLNEQSGVKLQSRDCGSGFDL